MSAIGVRERAVRRPIWLTDARADVLALAALLAGLVPALAPLAAEGMPATHDGFLHLQRLVALEAAARGSAPFTRWLPDLAYGYGQPVFNYYAPLAYAPALLARALSIDTVASFEIGTALWLILSGFAMYACARALFGPLAALAAALVYAYLPYQLVDIYVRGALAETAAFAWLPLIGRCLISGRRDGRAPWPVGLAIGVAGLILTHNVTALLAAPAFGGLALLLWSEGKAGHPHRLATGWRRPAWGGGLGVGLAAWFWLPAITERDLVQIGETIEPALFASFFIRHWPPIPLGLAYDYVEPVSVALRSPIFWPQVGLVQALVTVLGVLSVRRARGVARNAMLWAAGLALAAFLLQVGPAEHLYRLVPLASFVQFPWRLLTLVGLASALLAGGLVEHLPRTREVRLLAGVAVAGVSIGAAAWNLSPPVSYPEARFLTTDGVLRVELADHALGTTHSGEYLPIASGVRNSARFRKDLLDDPPPTDAVGTPVGFRIHDLRWTPHAVTFRASAPAADRVLLHQFAFPGWSATVNGGDTALGVGGKFGLLAVDVPAGESTVEVRWGWTPLRLGALALSLAALVGLAPLAGGWRQSRARLAVAAASSVAVLAIVVGPVIPPALAQSGAPRWHPIGDHLALIRSDLDVARLAADGSIEVRLMWLALDGATAGTSVTLNVESDTGAIHSAPWVYGGLARHWERGEIVPTITTLRLPPTFPNGVARVTAQVTLPDVAQPSARQRQPAQGEPRGAGNSSAEIDLGTIDVTARPTTRTIPRGVPTFNGVAALDRRLLTQSGAWQAARPGDWVDADVTFGVPSADVPRLDLSGVLVVRAGSREIASDAQRIGDWFAPLPFWQAGDVWRQRIRLALPHDLAAGDYESHVRLYGRELGIGGLAQPGASTWRPRGRPLAELDLGNLTVRR